MDKARHQPSILEIGAADPELDRTISWDTQTIVGTEDEDDVEEISRQQDNTARRLLPKEVSDRLEPFEALPIHLNKFGEHLVSFYLLQYPKETYAFNQNLNPHPVYTNFAIAMNAPACFQVILARSALYRISGNKYGTALEKAQLETAVIQHKTNAIHHIRKLSTTKGGNKDELVASIISMGTLDKRMGATTSADMHYSAVRRLLKSLGGPLGLSDLRLKRVSCFFECIYGTVRDSYVWEKSDFSPILQRFNIYLSMIWNLRNSRATTKSVFRPILQAPPQLRVHSVSEPSVQADAPLIPRVPIQSSSGSSSQSNSLLIPRLLSQSRSGSSYQGSVLPIPRLATKPGIRPSVQSSSLINQGRVSKPAPHPKTPSRRRGAALSSARLTMQPLPISKDPLSSQPATGLPGKAPDREKRPYWTLEPDSILYQRLSKSQGEAQHKDTSGLIWDLICLFSLTAIVIDHTRQRDHDPKSLTTYMARLSKIVHDANLHVSENNANMMWLIQTNDSTEDHSRRMWDVASFAWVCKHLNISVQTRLRNWLFTYLIDEELQGEIKLSAFDFSYDSQLP